MAAAQYGPHRWSAGEYDSDHTDAIRGARFAVADLTATTFVDCDLSRVKIIDSWLVDVDVSGHVSNFVVNGVDVTAFVAAELDRRHPERVQLRGMRTADDHRAMWDTIERLWSDAVARAERLPDAAHHQRVDDEWSFVETLRHLVFVTDAWARRTVLDEPLPYHPLGVPQTAYPRADAAALGIDLTARPSFAEAMSARADRMALIRGLVDGLTDSELERPCTRMPAPGYPEETRTVGSCLEVVMDEECEHLRFAVRDLATLEAASQGLTGSRAGRDRLTRPAHPA
jgi:uncharacterized damage-inducible protein DinB